MGPPNMADRVAELQGDADADDRSLAFEAATTSALPPPPRPAVLDSLVPVDYRLEAQAERARIARTHRRRRAIALLTGSLTASVLAATAIVLATLGALPTPDLGGWMASLTPAPADARVEPLTPVPRLAVGAATRPPSAPEPPSTTPTQDGVDPELGDVTAEAGAIEIPPSPRASSARSPGVRPRADVVSWDPSLPLVPDRAAVRQAMEGVRGAVEQCAAGLPGVARLVVTVAPTGKVRHALVQGDFAGRREGTCMARAVRDAEFPRFRKRDFRVAYPYPLAGRAD